MNDSKMTVKLRPVFDGETEWSEDAVRSLVGQTPRINGGEPATITRAWIQDGWVMVEFVGRGVEWTAR